MCCYGSHKFHPILAIKSRIQFNMGQALKKFSSGLLPFPANIVASQGGDDALQQLLSLLSQNGELATNGSEQSSPSIDNFPNCRLILVGVRQDGRGEESNASKYGQIIDEYYDKYFTNKEWTKADFYRAVSEIVEKINQSLGNTQFRVPEGDIIEDAYIVHHGERRDRKLEREEFQKILQSVIVKTGVTGIGAKDTLIYIFGVPVSALLLKQRVLPKALPNQVFIPLVTSATVLILAQLNKI